MNLAYSTKTAFDWIFSHYIMGGEHYTFVSPEFFPYHTKNPPSSNPLELYENFYKAWKHGDEHAHAVLSKRMSLRSAVDVAVENGRLDEARKRPLKELIDAVDCSLFYPFVYMVDLDKISPDRLEVKGSGVEVGSSEYVISDLRESEFELLFAHFREDPELKRVILDAIAGTVYLDSYQIVEFMKGRSLG